MLKPLTNKYFAVVCLATATFIITIGLLATLSSRYVITELRISEISESEISESDESIGYELQILSYSKINKEKDKGLYDMYCKAIYVNADPNLNLDIKYIGDENKVSDDKYIEFHIMKITGMYKALLSIYEELLNNNPLKINKTVILFADAFDVFYQSSKEEILDRFLSLNNSQNVIYMSENNAWPPMVKQMYPKNETIFINAGVWVGFIKPCLDLYKMMNEWIENDPKATYIDNKGKKWWLGDQDIIAWTYINQTYDTNYIGKKIIILDRNEFLFQSMNGKREFVKFNGNKYYNNKSKHYPLLVHYNGNKSPINADVNKFLKLNNRTKINGNVSIQIENGSVKYEQLCKPFTQYYF